MKILTTRFGEVEIEDEACFNIVSPILGYEDETSFVLIEHKDDSCFRWMQSTSTPELAFVVTVAGLWGVDYSFELPDATQEDLSIEDAEDILALNTVVIPHENPRAATINLLAPMIFNLKNHKGAQVVLAGSSFTVDYPLFKKEAVC